MNISEPKIGMIEEIESELITLSDALAKVALQPFTGCTAERIVQLAAQIGGTVAKVL